MLGRSMAARSWIRAIGAMASSAHHGTGNPTSAAAPGRTATGGGAAAPPRGTYSRVNAGGSAFGENCDAGTCTAAGGTGGGAKPPAGGLFGSNGGTLGTGGGVVMTSDIGEGPGTRGGRKNPRPR